MLTLFLNTPYNNNNNNKHLYLNVVQKCGYFKKSVLLFYNVGFTFQNTKKKHCWNL